MEVCLSFDDGRIDAYDAYQVLKKYKLKASFHITTGFIDGSFKTDSFGIERKPLTMNQLVEMFEGDMDISSHGDRHVMENADFVTSLSKLKKWSLVRGEKVGFSVPNSDYKPDELSKFISSNSDHLSYVRVGRSPKCYSFLSKVNYVLYHTFHLFSSYESFNKHNLINRNELNLDCLYSLVVKCDTKAKHLITFIDRHKTEDVVLIIMLHSIVGNPQNGWEFSLDDFTKLVEYLSSNVNVVTLKELSDKF